MGGWENEADGEAEGLEDGCEGDSEWVSVDEGRGAAWTAREERRRTAIHLLKRGDGALDLTDVLLGEKDGDEEDENGDMVGRTVVPRCGYGGSCLKQGYRDVGIRK
jgi:hypothetical protein